MTRVLSPQLVVAQFFLWPFGIQVLDLKDFGKVRAKIVLVPDCNALPSPIIASIE